MKRFILLVIIFAMAFTACNKKSETAAIVTAESYAKILKGDLSDFAGTWVNGLGERRTLRADGVFVSGSMKNLNASGFNEYNGSYFWGVYQDSTGFQVTLYPVGVPINLVNEGMGFGETIESDITKVRIIGSNVVKNGEVYYREGQTPTAETIAPQTRTANPHPDILSGDFSEFAGTWVNGFGRIQFRADGTFGEGSSGYRINADGTFNYGSAYGFELNKDGSYSWYVSWGGESMGYYLTLFPPGVEIMMDDSYPPQILLTDTTKVRIADTAKGIHSSNEVYYREGEAQAALEYEELRAGSSVTGVVGRDWKERFNIRSVDTFYISLVIESEVEILLDVYNGQQFIKSSIDDSGEYHSRIEIAAQPNTVYLLEVSSYVRDVTEAAFRISAHLSQ